MHIAEVVTIAKSLPLLRLNTYKSLILSYSADYRRIFRKNTTRRAGDFCWKREAWPCISVQSRNYFCAQNENDWLMRLTERRKNGGKQRWRQIWEKSPKICMRRKRDLSESVERQQRTRNVCTYLTAEYFQAGKYGHSSQFAFRGWRLGPLVGRVVIHGSRFQKNGITKKGTLKSP